MNSPASATTPEPTGATELARLLGLVAYAELSAFEHLATDASLAPRFEQRVTLLEAAAHRMDRHRAFAARLADDGADPVAAMDPYRMLVDDFHARTAPRGWPEALLKGWVCDGFTTDWYAEVSGQLSVPPLGPPAGAGVTAPLAVDGPRWVAEVLRDDPAAVGRLALWARRLVGEAATCAQRVAADDDALASLVSGSQATAGTGITEVHALIARLLRAHDARMVTVGLRA